MEFLLIAALVLILLAVDCFDEEHRSDSVSDAPEGMEDSSN